MGFQNQSAVATPFPPFPHGTYSQACRKENRRSRVLRVTPQYSNCIDRSWALFCSQLKLAATIRDSFPLYEENICPWSSDFFIIFFWGGEGGGRWDNCVNSLLILFVVCHIKYTECDYWIDTKVEKREGVKSADFFPIHSFLASS